MGDANPGPCPLCRIFHEMLPDDPFERTALRVAGSSASVEVPVRKRRKAKKPVTFILPRYHVVLLDDDDHTYAYVIEMLVDLFGHSDQTAYEMACKVDADGRVIVCTTTMERAELKKDQIHAYGPDWRMPGCSGSMSARIEPAE